jgi:hypothetical protein
MYKITCLNSLPIRAIEDRKEVQDVNLKARRFSEAACRK